MLRIAALLLITTSLCAGCAHAPLRRNTLRQAQTLSDVYEQQVLDNIALAIASPHTTPYFALPKGGSTQITQSGNSTVGLTWNPRTLVSETLNLNGSGSLTENWSLEPVTNPDRLDLMRCLIAHTCCQDTSACQDCETKLELFFKDKYPECLPVCFFGHGAKCDVPKRCSKVGRFEDTYVWVRQPHYADLHALTLAVLDIVTAELKDFGPPSNKTIKVTQRFKGANGQELEGEFNVSPEDYKKMLGEMNKIYGLDSQAFELQSDLLVPNKTIDSQPLFRERKESNDGAVQSLLLLPRQ